MQSCGNSEMNLKTIPCSVYRGSDFAVTPESAEGSGFFLLMLFLVSLRD
jgi:hypothetical protein